MIVIILLMTSFFPERGRRVHEAGQRDGEDRRRFAGREEVLHLLIKIASHLLNKYANFASQLRPQCQDLIFHFYINYFLKIGNKFWLIRTDYINGVDDH